MIDDESQSFVRSQKLTPPDTGLKWHFEEVPGRLSIVVPVYLDVTGLCDTLVSLAHCLEQDGTWEIIVVNDGADAEICRIATEQGAEVVDITPNRGSYATRNAGIEFSRGEIIAFLDADVRVSRRWYSQLRQNSQRYDIFAGRIRMALGPRPSVAEWYQAVSYFPRQYAESEGLLTTANLVVRRSVLEAIGGFDRRLRSAGDYEFSLRAKNAEHFRIGYSEEMEVLHPCRNFRQLLSSAERTFYGQRNLLELYGVRARPAVKSISSLTKLAMPRLNLFLNREVSATLSAWTKVRVWLFAWYLKIRTIRALIRVRRAFRRV
jgi:glycosyltransferase involved in cell wall biosynthesis